MVQMLARTASTERRGLALATALLAGFSVQLAACSSETAGEPARSGGEAGSPAVQGQAQSGEAAEQVFHIATLHLDGKANVNGAGDHSPEPFPATAPKNSGGFIMTPPNQKGEWSVRAFAFHPAQVVVRQGDRVSLSFMGVQGPAHTIAIDGQQEQLSLKRGEVKTVRFVADQPGVVRFTSVGREPTMQGSVLVLPRDPSR